VLPEKQVIAEPSDGIEDHRDLWAGGSFCDWVLLKVNDSGSYIPYNVKTRLMRVIENHTLAVRVMERRLVEGVRVFDKAPPEGLANTVSHLLRAYPNGLPEADCLALVFLLLENMSHRNLATVLTHVFGRDSGGVLNDIGNAVAMEHSGTDSICQG
jgi:hypothetical protein